ncbi:FAD-dependent oxidoreductase [Deinococcus altitudinis]|uniref:FAD-dependent oxidoreductase n=1 Tax=Deinococcus altitudinis TaxID=468914 RepID=UPI0038924C8D
MLTPPARSQPQPGHLYDVAVVGAGVAGCELAYRLARGTGGEGGTEGGGTADRPGQDVLLVSQALDHLGNLYAPTTEGAEFPQGSLFADVARQVAPSTDGKAIDGWAFHRALKARLEDTGGIHLLQSCVTAVTEDAGSGEKAVTLSTWEGPPLRARRVVLAVGAFLKARLLVGDSMEDAGRLSEVAYDFLADDLASWGLWLTPTERQTASGEGAYEVRFLTVPAAEQDDFLLRRTDAVYALGQMTAGEHSYASVLRDAARLAAELLNFTPEPPERP